MARKKAIRNSIIREIAHKWAEEFAENEITKIAELVVNNIPFSFEVKKTDDVSSGLVDVPVGISKSGLAFKSNATWKQAIPKSRSAKVSMKGSTLGPCKKQCGLADSGDLGLSNVLATTFSQYDKENIIPQGQDMQGEAQNQSKKIRNSFNDDVISFF